MNFNESITYRGYTITKRKSICDDVVAYYSIKLGDKFITCVNSIQIAKVNIDEWISNYDKRR